MTPMRTRGHRPLARCARKAQAEMLEHLLLILFIVILLVFLLVGLAGWQASQFKLEQSRQETQRALSVATLLLRQPYSRDGVFNDAQLTALGNACDQLPSRSFAEIKLLAGTGVQCTLQNYPACDTWELCASPTTTQIAYLIPVNVEQQLGSVERAGVTPRVRLAVLRVGVLT